LATELVELHGGKILVESELFKGSVFTVLLPLGRAHLRDEEIVESSERLPMTSDQLPVNSDQLSVISEQHPASSIEDQASSIQDQASSNEHPATDTPLRRTGKKTFILITRMNTRGSRRISLGRNRCAIFASFLVPSCPCPQIKKGTEVVPFLQKNMYLR
jgi:hypothetical protein